MPGPHIDGRHEQAARIPPVYQLRQPCDPAEDITYTIYLNAGRGDELEGRIEEVAASGGPWLTKEQVDEYTKPKPDYLFDVKAYLAQHGLDGDKVQVAHQGEQLTVHSTAAQVDEMWDTALHHFHNTQTGADVVRSNRGYTVPAKLTKAILTLAPFASFATISHGPVHMRPLHGGEL